jgi:hypothetical protein
MLNSAQKKDYIIKFSSSLSRAFHIEMLNTIISNDFKCCIHECADGCRITMNDLDDHTIDLLYATVHKNLELVIDH